MISGPTYLIEAWGSIESAGKQGLFWVIVIVGVWIFRKSIKKIWKKPKKED